MHCSMSTLESTQVIKLPINISHELSGTRAGSVSLRIDSVSLRMDSVSNNWGGLVLLPEAVAGMEERAATTATAERSFILLSCYFFVVCVSWR